MPGRLRGECGLRYYESMGGESRLMVLRVRVCVRVAFYPDRLFFPRVVKHIFCIYIYASVNVYR